MEVLLPLLIASCFALTLCVFLVPSSASILDLSMEPLTKKEYSVVVSVTTTTRVLVHALNPVCAAREAENKLKEKMGDHASYSLYVDKKNIHLLK